MEPEVTLPILLLTTYNYMTLPILFFFFFLLLLLSLLLLLTTCNF